MEYVKLTDICQPKQWKTIPISKLSNEGYPVYGANGLIGCHSEYTHEYETIMIGCRGSCGTVSLSQPFSYINGNAMALDNLDEDIVRKKYLYYFLKYRGFNDVISGSSQPQITKTSLEKVEIPIFSISYQEEIINTLDKMQELISLKNFTIDKIETLKKSLFIKYFGDLQKNPFSWKIFKLDDLAEVVSGVTKGKKNNKPTIELPYMRVANVQDGYLNLSEVKTIEVTESDAEKYQLKDGDVLLTEGGDPDKLGRGTVWREEVPNCIHQNHIFRVRTDQKILNPEYLSKCVGSFYGKTYFLKSAKQTTGIATINSTQLKGFPVPIPPIELQNKFARIIEEINKRNDKMHESLMKLNENYNALLQRVFTGELIKQKVR